jgi:6-phosphogluconolactonase
MRLLLMVLFLLGCVRPIEAAAWVYVSIAGEKRIAIYAMNLGTGELTHRHDVATPGEPGSLTTDPRKRFLFAAMRSTGDLTSFRLDQATGNLTQVSKVSAGADPAFVATDQTGKFLLLAYYQAGKVAVHRIDEDGSLSEQPVASLPTDKNAHAIQTDASNRFAFVPHTGPNAIFQFRFDATTGNLAANSVPIVSTGRNTGPRHLAFHPKLPMAYFDNEQGSSVTAYRLNAETGLISPQQTLPTLPEDFNKSNSCAHLEISPDGRFLYAANRGHDSLAGYEVDATTGRLTSLGQTPTEATPRSFNISPDGKFLYAAGQSSGKLAAYLLNQKTGGLDRFATYEVGKSPWWVLVVELKD